MAAALAVVKRAPHSVQPFLQRSAFDAFHSGLLVACLAGAVVAAIGAVAAWMLLPGRNAPAGLPEGPAGDIGEGSDVDQRSDVVDDAQVEGCPNGLAPLPA